MCWKEIKKGGKEKEARKFTLDSPAFRLQVDHIFHLDMIFSD